MHGAKYRYPSKRFYLQDHKSYSVLRIHKSYTNMNVAVPLSQPICGCFTKWLFKGCTYNLQPFCFSTFHFHSRLWAINLYGYPASHQGSINPCCPLIYCTIHRKHTTPGAVFLITHQVQSDSEFAEHRAT